jgi:general secretion pathway protein G
VTRTSGFTLIELLTVIVILSILFTVIAFAATGARSNARDERRRADMAEIASGLEVFRADCGEYPTESEFSSVPAGGSLQGNGSSQACSRSSVYLREMPADPESPAKRYSYNPDPLTGGYTLCAALETSPQSTPVSNCSVSCGAENCNYVIDSP